MPNKLEAYRLHALFLTFKCFDLPHHSHHFTVPKAPLLTDSYYGTRDQPIKIFYQNSVHEESTLSD